METLWVLVFSSPAKASLVFSAIALKIEVECLPSLSMVLVELLNGFIPVKYHLANSDLSMTPSLFKSKSFSARSNCSSVSTAPSNAESCPSSSLSIAPLPSASNLLNAFSMSSLNFASRRAEPQLHASRMALPLSSSFEKVSTL